MYALLFQKMFFDSIHPTKKPVTIEQVPWIYYFGCK